MELQCVLYAGVPGDGGEGQREHMSGRTPAEA